MHKCICLVNFSIFYGSINFSRETQRDKIAYLEIPDIGHGGIVAIILFSENKLQKRGKQRATPKIVFFKKFKSDFDKLFLMFLF